MVGRIIPPLVSVFSSMVLPVLAASFWAVGVQMTSPVSVAQPVRLALSPMLDGKIEAEEWDSLGTFDGVQAYLQWEPGRIHAAATLDEGKDLIISLDFGADGWLLGKDNLEVRLSMRNGSVEVSERLLDGTSPSGPVWVDAAAFMAATKAQASVEAGKWSVEMSLQDPGLGWIERQPQRPLRVRFDGVDAATPPIEAYMPRETGLVSLQFDRVQDMPEGMNWKPEYRGRSIMPGNQLKLRLTFSRKDEATWSQIETRAEGLAKAGMRSEGLPFPAFDKKNRAFVDYESAIEKDAPYGYRVLRSTLTGQDGKTTIVQTSFAVAPVIEFELVREPIKASDEPKAVRISAYLRSNSTRRVDGRFSVTPPTGWEVESGNNKQFVIANARGSKRQVFSLIVPGGFRGTAPLTLRAEYPGAAFEQLVWITVS